MENSIFKTLPFYLPSISWYAQYIQAGHAQIVDVINKKEFKLKQTRLASSTGLTQLAIPIKGGRAVHLPISQIEVCDDVNWKSTHFKTIKSIYGKAPFFEYFSAEIEAFYLSKHQTLLEFNLASISLINQLIGLKLPIEIVDSPYHFAPSPTLSMNYNQVFMPNIPFVPNCSMLDAVLCEGRSIVNSLRNIKTI